MNQLKHDWLTEGLIDYEYKKYILLAYLKDIRNRFNMTELYPFLSELVMHYRNLQRIKADKELIYENFPRLLSRADFQKLEFTYQKMVNDDDIMNEIEEILSFAIPAIEKAINEGKELHEFVEENMELEPVGICSIYENEGYLLINQAESTNVQVYRYQVTLFESSEEKYRGINTTFVQNDFRNFARTYEGIKRDLIRRFNDLPHPATYVVSSKFKFPELATLLPVAKRLLIRTISVT